MLCVIFDFKKKRKRHITKVTLSLDQLFSEDRNFTNSTFFTNEKLLSTVMDYLHYLLFVPNTVLEYQSKCSDRDRRVVPQSQRKFTEQFVLKVQKQWSCHRDSRKLYLLITLKISSTHCKKSPLH